MSVAQRSYPSSFVRRLGGLGLASALAATFAGCSANIARLDAPPSFGLGAGTGSTSIRNSNANGDLGGTSLPDAGQPATAYSPPPATRPQGRVEVAGLPAIEEPKARALAVTRQPAPGAVPAASTSPPPAQTSSRGQQIEVQPGDTLYGLSRRHKVMISDLMTVNGLQNPNLKPGQKLYLPASAGVRPTPQVRPVAPAAARAAEPAQPPVQEQAQLAVQSPYPSTAPVAGETYTVKPGDSLYAIASRHKLKVADLQRANGITNARTVRPGTVLRIPGGEAAPTESGDGGSSAAAIAKAGPPTQRLAAVVPGGAAGAPSGLKVLNADGDRHAALGGQPTMTDAAPAATPPAAPIKAVAAAAAPAPSASAPKLRWPVKGRIIQGFGARPDGSHNDGVDIAVPAGADVLAAESGVVAYAGNEVKTYGNLVLVRHDNGLVTAYAYNEKLLVQRGDRVKRGQPIAKAGKTGLADQPQVHFEVRVGSKPVDPIGYLEKM
jgi:murein DD-endopeptidase MepM/ murein hydrolase activator NlpD